MLHYIGQKTRGIAALGMKAMSSVGAGLAMGSKATGALAGLAGAVTGAASLAGLSNPAMAAAAQGVMKIHAGMSAANKVSQAAGGVVDAAGSVRKSFLEK
jgi:hypothetical protein